MDRHPRSIIRALVQMLVYCSVVVALQCRVAVCQTVPPTTFRILVLGDSVMWGQGLKDEHKFSNKIRCWIYTRKHGSDDCNNPDDVQIHVEAHSGAVITRPLTAHQRAKENPFLRSENPEVYAGEVNYGNPTMWGQIELARRHYATEGVPLTDVNLIFVNGGINDMGAAKILLPELGGNIDTHAQNFCRDQMADLLDELAKTFPNARIMIPGYFPLVSEKTPWNILRETIGYLLRNKKDVGSGQGSIREESDMESESLPISEKQSKILTLLARRSTQWVAASNAAFIQAVDQSNAAHPLPDNTLPPGEASQRAIFVPVIFDDDNAYAAPETFLWRLVRKPAAVTYECTDHDPLRNLIVNDEVQPERPCMCKNAKHSKAISCPRAATFHPNREGAQRYFSAIKTKLEPILNSMGW